MFQLHHNISTHLSPTTSSFSLLSALDTTEASASHFNLRDLQTFSLPVAAPEADQDASLIILLQQFKDLNIKHDELQCQYKHLETENIEYELHIGELHRKISTLSETIKTENALNVKYEQMQREYKHIETQNIEYQSYIDELQQKITTHSETIRTEHDVNAQRKETIKQLKTENIEYQSHIDELQQQIATHAKTAKTEKELHKSKLMEHEETIKQLKRENNEIKKQNATYKISLQQKQNIQIRDNMINVKINVNIGEHDMKDADNVSESKEMSVLHPTIALDSVKLKQKIGVYNQANNILLFGLDFKINSKSFSNALNPLEWFDLES